LFFSAREAAGAEGIRHSLRPLVIRGTLSGKTSGDQRRGIAESHLEFNIIASEAQQSMSRRKGRMDCFVAEPVIGRAFARPVGSSQ
jgi:hypothetical protein